MHKIKIISIGKTKESWLQEAIEDYSGRLKSTVSLEWILAKNPIQLNEVLKKEPHFLCLDPRGIEYTSEEFSRFLLRQLTVQGARCTFVIGGAEGIPKEITARATSLVSFSRMTFTHQAIRLLLVEQIYRAFEIDKGSQYHK